MTERKAFPNMCPEPGTNRYAALDAAALRALLAERDAALADMAASHDEFLRAVSHDLRAPLRHITSYGPLVRELLEDAAPTGVSPDAQQEALAFLGTMDQSARRMGKMLDGLLALSRVARAPLQSAPVDLAALVQEAQSVVAGAAQGRAVEWSLATHGVGLVGDAALLRQLLGELLGNALKFTRRRDAQAHAAHIAVKAQRTPDGGVLLQVQDDGVGFDAARAGALFGVFQRLHREGDFDGVGVGLATARAIVQRHGGRIGITAAPEVGCTVTVEWPAEAARGPGH